MCFSAKASFAECDNQFDTLQDVELPPPNNVRVLSNLEAMATACSSDALRHETMAAKSQDGLRPI